MSRTGHLLTNGATEPLEFLNPSQSPRVQPPARYAVCPERSIANDWSCLQQKLGHCIPALLPSSPKNLESEGTQTRLHCTFLSRLFSPFTFFYLSPILPISISHHSYYSLSGRYVFPEAYNIRPRGSGQRAAAGSVQRVAANTRPGINSPYYESVPEYPGIAEGRRDAGRCPGSSAERL